MKLLSIQYLRAIAALMVVAMHLTFQINRLGGNLTSEFIPTLHAGVDIFFVISGFVMWTSTHQRPMTVLSFWRNRLIRIVPMYWLMTTVLVSVALVLPGALASVKFDALHVMTSYLFVPWPDPNVAGDTATWPILVVGWSINCEMAFYFIFGLGLLMFRGRSSSGERPLLALFVVFVMLVLALLHFTPLSKWPVAGFYLSYRNLEFAGGVVLGAGLNRGWGRGDARWSIGLIALGVMMIATAVEVFGLGEMHDYCFLAAAILIVGGAVAYERAATLPGISIMLLIGDASYSIYLSHPMMLSLVAQLWKRLPYGSGAAGLIAFSGMALVLSTVAGMLIHVFIERPLSRLLRYVKPPASHSLALWTGISGRTIREAS